MACPRVHSRLHEDLYCMRDVYMLCCDIGYKLLPLHSHVMVRMYSILRRRLIIFFPDMSTGRFIVSSKRFGLWPMFSFQGAACLASGLCFVPPLRVYINIYVSVCQHIFYCFWVYVYISTFCTNTTMLNCALSQVHFSLFCKALF